MEMQLVARMKRYSASKTRVNALMARNPGSPCQPEETLPHCAALHAGYTLS